MYYMGIDLHKKYFVSTIMNKEGKVLKRSRVSTDRESIKTRAIAEARIKTDSIDSNTLAHLLRSDLIPRAYTPSFETRDLRNLLRFRMALVKVRRISSNNLIASNFTHSLDGTLHSIQLEN